MQTLLVGNFGDHNLGDEMILFAALQQYPDGIVMTSDPVWSQDFTAQSFETVPFFPTGVRSFCKYVISSGYRELLRTVSTADQIIFPGGGLFAIHTRACWIWYLTIIWLRFYAPGTHIHLQHQGVDQRLSWLGRFFLRQSLRRVQAISVRDHVSFEAVQTLLSSIPKRKRPQLTLDQDRVTKWLQDLPKNQFQKNSREKSKDIESVLNKKFVLLSTKFPINQTIVDKIRKKTNLQTIVFVPFQASDTQAVKDLKNIEIQIPKNVAELLHIVSCAEYVIGERLHSLITGDEILGTEKTFLLRKPYSEKVSNYTKQKTIATL